MNQPAKSLHQAYWCLSRKDRSQKWKGTHTITTSVYIHNKPKPREIWKLTQEPTTWLSGVQPPLWIHCSPHIEWDKIKTHQEWHVHLNTVNTGWWRPWGRALKHGGTGAMWRSLRLHSKPSTLMSLLVEGPCAHICFRQRFPPRRWISYCNPLLNEMGKPWGFQSYFQL